ncbi:MAG: lipoate--protein ligase family protein [Gemmatimonadota bacterium]
MREAIPTWRLLETAPRSGIWNMACDEAVLEAVGHGASPPTVRFYAWDPPAVSLGRHQPDPDVRARAALEALGVTWVRRPTGGRLVHHGSIDLELTYSVVAPLGEPPLAGGLTDAYRRIHEGLAAGLGRLGLAVELAPMARGAGPRLGPTSRLACFAATVPWEIEAGGRKLLGSAQRRSRGALLQHGSLPLAGDPSSIPERVWPGSFGTRVVTTVSAVAGRPIGFAEVADALRSGIEETLNVRLTPGVLTDRERASVREGWRTPVPTPASA